MHILIHDHEGNFLGQIDEDDSEEIEKLSVEWNIPIEDLTRTLLRYGLRLLKKYKETEKTNG